MSDLVRIRLTALHQAARRRYDRHEYLQRVLEAGKPHGCWLVMERSVYDRLRAELYTYPPAPVPAENVTGKDPAAPAQGLGDTVAAVLHTLRVDRLVEWWGRKRGKRCRCAERRALLNRLVPYRRRRALRHL